MQQCGSCPRGPFCAFAHVDSKPFIPEEPSFPTPSSPPPPRPPDPIPARETSSSPSRLNVGPASAPASDHFTPASVGSCVAEQGLLGNVLSLCEDAGGGAEPLSPWTGEGGYCRAPGFEREDQVRRTAEVRARRMNDVMFTAEAYRACSCVIFCRFRVFSGQAEEFRPGAAQ